MEPADEQAIEVATPLMTRTSAETSSAPKPGWLNTAGMGVLLK